MSLALMLLNSERFLSQVVAIANPVLIFFSSKICLRAAVSWASSARSSAPVTLMMGDKPTALLLTPSRWGDGG